MPTSPSSLFLSVPPAGPYCLPITSLFYRKRASFCSLPSQNFRSFACPLLALASQGFISLNPPYHPSSLEDGHVMFLFFHYSTSLFSNFLQDTCTAFVIIKK